MDRVQPNFVTKRELAVAYLRRLLTTGQVRPFDRIRIRDVALHLRISDTPVREAIKQLVSEGLLMETAHVGATVPYYSAEDIQEVMEMRAVLAALAITLNAPLVTPDTIARLDELIADGQAALKAGDVSRYRTINRDFHAVVRDLGPYEFLKRTLQTLSDRSRFADFNLLPNRMAESHAEHQQIRDALAEGRFADAAEITRAHELAALPALLRYASERATDLS
jgi:DNA-binding GntR family transcriptional regulator